MVTIWLVTSSLKLPSTLLSSFISVGAFSALSTAYLMISFLSLPSKLIWGKSGVLGGFFVALSFHVCGVFCVCWGLQIFGSVAIWGSHSVVNDHQAIHRIGLERKPTANHYYVTSIVGVNSVKTTWVSTGFWQTLRTTGEPPLPKQKGLWF